MKVFRFMDKKEFDLLSCGADLVSNRDHSLHARSGSIGFCFLSSEDFNPETAIDFLTGLVGEYACVEFFVPCKHINKSWGVYSTLFGEQGSVTEITEYCTTEYSRSTMKPMRYSLLSGYPTFEWHPWN